MSWTATGQQDQGNSTEKTMEALQTQKPLIVGEVLFDHFPDGRRILGGAPFNVAWNLQRLGLPPSFCSAVGEDDEGREIIEEMKLGELDVTGLQVTERWPTG
ncbi:MAG: PfkB family carbohydrate kinase, partial [Pirellulales bacterium]|nr:PfkB family carbohydrate kinase [Pirellulales bacterium]